MELEFKNCDFVPIDPDRYKPDNWSDKQWLMATWDMTIKEVMARFKHTFR